MRAQAAGAGAGAAAGAAAGALVLPSTVEVLSVVVEVVTVVAAGSVGGATGSGASSRLHDGLASHSSLQVGRGQSTGRWHCQSQVGASHTLSQVGEGLLQTVWHTGLRHTVVHSGQLPFSHLLVGQRTSQSGLPHLISHLEQESSSQRVVQRGASQTGSHTWLQTGESHFHWHLGWQSSCGRTTRKEWIKARRDCFHSLGARARARPHADGAESCPRASQWSTGCQGLTPSSVAAGAASGAASWAASPAGAWTSAAGVSAWGAGGAGACGGRTDEKKKWRGGVDSKQPGRRRRSLGRSRGRAPGQGASRSANAPCGHAAAAAAARRGAARGVRPRPLCVLLPPPASSPRVATSAQSGAGSHPEPRPLPEWRPGRRGQHAWLRCGSAQRWCCGAASACGRRLLCRALLRIRLCRAAGRSPRGCSAGNRINARCRPPLKARVSDLRRLPALARSLPRAPGAGAAGGPRRVRGAAPLCESRPCAATPLATPPPRPPSPRGAAPCRWAQRCSCPSRRPAATVLAHRLRRPVTTRRPQAVGFKLANGSCVHRRRPHYGC